MNKFSYKQISHGNLTATNVLVSGDISVPKLTGFGLLKYNPLDGVMWYFEQIWFTNQVYKALNHFIIVDLLGEGLQPMEFSRTISESMYTTMWCMGIWGAFLGNCITGYNKTLVWKNY